MMKSKLFGILCMIILFASCTDSSIYRQSKAIADEGWNKDSAVRFIVPVADTVNEFDIYINIRNKNDYPYQNLYLFVETTSSRGISIADTINLPVADDYGKWTGKSISRIWENRFLFRKNIKFANSGQYTFEIRQGMRHDILNGISDVGIEINPEE
ncbi:MAG: gliding motility lipoprotein GldH [Prevotellaceae bacterium]|jgi:gliding motility-associated lipoprotein GldH|nr:gliding motility lipoprotein GldH [Prevotellaceae bacterium]